MAEVNPYLLLDWAPVCGAYFCRLDDTLSLVCVILNFLRSWLMSRKSVFLFLLTFVFALDHFWMNRQLFIFLFTGKFTCVF